MASSPFATNWPLSRLLPADRSRRTWYGTSLICVICMFTLTALSGCQPPRPQKVEGIEIVIEDANFEKKVLQSAVPVLVEFGATWCGPCQYMEPIVATLSVDFKGRANVGKVDVDESPAISDEYAIEGLPTFLIFKDGKEVGRVVGSQSYRTLAEMLESFLSEKGGSAT